MDNVQKHNVCTVIIGLFIWRLSCWQPYNDTTSNFIISLECSFYFFFLTALRSKWHIQFCQITFFSDFLIWKRRGSPYIQTCMVFIILCPLSSGTLNDLQPYCLNSLNVKDYQQNSNSDETTPCHTLFPGVWRLISVTQRSNDWQWRFWKWHVPYFTCSRLTMTHT
jgi:hypothetical protein